MRLNMSFLRFRRVPCVTVAIIRDQRKVAMTPTA